MENNRVAIIGGGISGLAAIKCCLDEGLEPVCFERTGEMGGLWRYTETPVDGQGCVMKSTVINTSKEMMSFSDFPVPAEYPVFMHNKQILHSHDYKNPRGFGNKRVLVIGIGNSGGDVAVELSRVASQVYLSTRRGTWIINRVSDQGLPADMLYTTRALWWLKDNMAQVLVGAVTRWKLNQRIDHEMFCLRPAYDPLQQHPMVNDDMPNRIVCGSIRIKTDVKRFTETGVEFVDGTAEDNIDVVVLATVYSFGFPFIDEEVIDVKGNVVNLYKNVFPSDLERNTLAIIGCLQPFGAISPAAELQSRAATKVFKRESFLPGREEMWQNIRDTRAFNARRYAQSRRHTIQVELIQYLDSLAELAGCSVDFGHLFRHDPILALKLTFGASTPYQYRLFGPGQWAGAREAIMTQWDRIYRPLKTRDPPAQMTSSPTKHSPFVTFAITVVIVFLIRFLFA